jgi:hypothetical protein
MRKFFRATIVLPLVLALGLCLYLAVSPTAYSPNSLDRQIDIACSVLSRNDMASDGKFFYANLLLEDLNEVGSKPVLTGIGYITIADYRLPAEFFAGRSSRYFVSSEDATAAIRILPCLGFWAMIGRFWPVVALILACGAWVVCQISLALREYEEYDILVDAEEEVFPKLETHPRARHA